MIRIILSFILLLFLSGLFAQDKRDYQSIILEKIPSGKIFLPKLVDTTGQKNIVLNKINASILGEFSVESYDETAEKPWDEIEIDFKIENDVALLSIYAVLDGSVTGFGQHVSEYFYFDLTNGNRLIEPDPIKPLSFFTTDGYLQFLKDYSIIEDYNIKAKEAIECADGSIPNCHLHQLEFSFYEDNISVSIDEYECYPRWGYACLFTAGASLKIKDFMKYVNVELLDYYKVLSRNNKFEILQKGTPLKIPKNYALFGKINDKYSFSMMFNISENNTDVNGHYYYNSKKELIKLKGIIENGKLLLKEYVNDEHTGTFIIDKTEDFNEKIYWESPDGKNRFNVTIDSKYSLFDLKT